MDYPKCRKLSYRNFSKYFKAIGEFIMYVYNQTTEGYEIVEKHSAPEPDRIIATFDNDTILGTTARKMFRNLKRGSGFGGWTPDFFGTLHFSIDN